MTRKSLFLLVFLVMVMAVMVACAPAPAAPAGEVAAGPTATPAPKPVKIVWWTDPRFQYIKGMEDQTSEIGDWERILAQQYMEMHPNVTIEVEALPWSDLPVKVPAAVAAGEPPDILRDYLGRTSGLAWQGLLENLEDLIPQEELDDYLPGLMDMLTINGHLHGLPDFYWAAGSLLVNKSCWDAVGKADMLPTMEDPDWTFEEYEAALKAVAAPDKVWPLALQVAQEQGDYNWLTYWWGMGGGIFKVGDYSHTTLNSPEGVEALKLIKKWYDEGLILPGAPTDPDTQTPMYTGQSCVVGGGIGSLPGLEAAKKEGRVTVDFEPLIVMGPSKAGVTRGLALGPTVSVVFKQKDEYKRQWVIDFLRWLHRPELVREYVINAKQFPPLKSVGVPIDDPLYAATLKWIQERPIHDLGLSAPNYYKIRVLQHPQLQAVLLGEKTPEQALADFEQQANKILAAR